MEVERGEGLAGVEAEVGEVDGGVVGGPRIRLLGEGGRSEQEGEQQTAHGGSISPRLGEDSRLLRKRYPILFAVRLRKDGAPGCLYLAGAEVRGLMMSSRRAGGAVRALEDWVALAVVIVEGDVTEGRVGLDEEVDRVGMALGVVKGLEEVFAGEDGAVDADDLLSGGELGLVGDAVVADVAQGAVGGDAEAERVPDVDASTAASSDGGEGACGLVELIDVDELVAAALDAGQVGVRGGDVDVLVEEAGPVVGQDLVEVAG